MNQDVSPVPARRSDRLVVEEIGDETLVYDLDRHQAHSLGRTAALVWRACDGRSTVPELAQLLPAEMPPADREAAVRLALDELAGAQLLSGPWLPSPSRRAWVLQAGLAASVALAPLVTSIAVRPAEAQLSVDGTGDADIVDGDLDD